MEDAAARVDVRTEAGLLYELTFDRRGDVWAVLVDGHVAMSSSGPRLESAIVDLAITPWAGRDDLTVLLAGLGMGQLLRALLDHAQVKHVVVVEHSPTILSWNQGPLAALNGSAVVDKRVSVVEKELFAYLRDVDATTGARPTGYAVVILDTDDWPVTLSRPENVDFYHEDGLLLLETALKPGGVFATHSVRRDDELETRIRVRFQSVARVGVPVEVNGETTIQYVYRGRRAVTGGGAS
jgi:spermidine synthase